MKTVDQSGVSALPAVSSADFVQAMGQHVSSVCVITTTHEGKYYGLTATAVSSVCATPPRLLICVNKSGTTYEKIVASGIFSVNVLTDAQDRIAKAFAGMFGKDFDRFSLGRWKIMTTGAPTLEGAGAVFDCVLAETSDQFSHSVFFGDVVGVDSAPRGDTLLYGGRRFREVRKIIEVAHPDHLETLHF